jgi:hypothetical protein
MTVRRAPWLKSRCRLPVPAAAGHTATCPTAVNSPRQSRLRCSKNILAPVHRRAGARNSLAHAPLTKRRLPSVDFAISPIIHATETNSASNSICAAKRGAGSENSPPITLPARHRLLKINRWDKATNWFVQPPHRLVSSDCRSPPRQPEAHASERQTDALQRLPTPCRPRHSEAICRAVLVWCARGGRHGRTGREKKSPRTFPTRRPKS